MKTFFQLFQKKWSFKINLNVSLAICIIQLALNVCSSIQISAVKNSVQCNECVSCSYNVMSVYLVATM